MEGNPRGTGMPAGLSSVWPARQTQTPFPYKGEEFNLLIRRGLVPATQFLAVEAVFCPRDSLEPIGRDLFSAGLALAISPACDALECIIDLPEHATANAGRGHVDVLFNTLDGKLHFVSRLNSRKSFRIVSGSRQKLLSLLQQHCSVRVFSCFQCCWHRTNLPYSHRVFTSSFLFPEFQMV